MLCGGLLGGLCVYTGLGIWTEQSGQKGVSCCRATNRTQQATSYYKEALSRNPYLWSAFSKIVDLGMCPLPWYVSVASPNSKMRLLRANAPIG